MKELTEIKQTINNFLQSTGNPSNDEVHEILYTLDELREHLNKKYDTTPKSFDNLDQYILQIIEQEGDETARAKAKTEAKTLFERIES